MIGPLLALALSAAPEILLPPWPLSPDGDLVAVRGADALDAQGARAVRAAPHVFRVVPAPGATRVTLRSAGAEAVAPVEPAPGTIEISARPPAAVKGRDAKVEIEVVVRRPGGEPDPDSPAPSLVVSPGRIGELAAAGPGRFRGTYEPLETRAPEVAFLLALVPRCPLCPTPRAVGHAVLPLAAAVDLPGRSEPGVRTTVTVAGRAFGPALADARGRFTVPVVIPPGARRAEGTAVDALGNRRTTPIDLALPPVDRLACVAWPRALPADGESEASLYCLASTAAGEPVERAALSAGASAGAVGAFATAAGPLQVARYRAPRGGGGAEAVVRVAYPDGGAASLEEIRVALATGAPAAVEVSVAREPVPHGASVRADATVRDARGDPVGRAAGPAGAAEGFVAPDRFVASREGREQQAALSFALEPGREAATLALRREGSGWLAEARTVDGRPAAGVTLRFGSGQVATTDARGEARAPGARPAETASGPGGLRAAGWAGIAPPRAPFEIARTVTVALRPPSPVDVVVRLEAGALRWRVEDAEGRPIPGRRVSLRAAGVDLAPAERDGDGWRAAVRAGGGTVAVVDAETGVAAVVDVP